MIKKYNFCNKGKYVSVYGSLQSTINSTALLKESDSIDLLFSLKEYIIVDQPIINEIICCLNNLDLKKLNMIYDSLNTLLITIYKQYSGIDKGIDIKGITQKGTPITFLINKNDLKIVCDDRTIELTTSRATSKQLLSELRDYTSELIRCFEEENNDMLFSEAINVSVSIRTYYNTYYQHNNIPLSIDDSTYIECIEVGSYKYHKYKIVLHLGYINVYCGKGSLILSICDDESAIKDIIKYCKDNIGLYKHISIKHVLFSDTTTYHYGRNVMYNLTGYNNNMLDLDNNLILLLDYILSIVIDNGNNKNTLTSVAYNIY